jgi:hypothetical protein
MILRRLLTTGYRIAQNKPSRVIQRNIIVRGFLGTNRFWWWIGATFWTGSMLRRVFGKHPESLGTEVLRRGQFVRVESLGALSRAQRKQLRKATTSR